MPAEPPGPDPDPAEPAEPPEADGIEGTDPGDPAEPGDLLEPDDGRTGWLATEAWLLDRLERLDWWEAARWAAGHERTRPRLTALALRSYITQAAVSGAKQEHLDAATERLAEAGRTRIWARSVLGPPDGIDAGSVEEVAELAVEIACDALTAVVLGAELDRGVLPERRHRQLLQAVERIGLQEGEIEGA